MAEIDSAACRNAIEQAKAKAEGYTRLSLDVSEADVTHSEVASLAR